MTSGFGVDPTLNGSGVPTSGTSAQDIRKINGGLYTPGIISGVPVSTSPSAMTYSVGAGVVAIQVATGEIILAPVPATTVTTTVAPGTGTRTDIVYAQQKYPSIEGNSDVVVGVSTVLPSRAVAIKKFIVSAGNTNTNQTVISGSQSFVIPYGATLPRLHYYQYTNSGSLPNGFTRVGQGSFYLPTDRLLRFSVSAVLNANGSTGFDNSKYCEYGLLPNIDGGDICIWSTPGLHQAWGVYQFSATIAVNAGQHTTNMGMVRIVGPGTAETHYGLFGSYGRRGIEYSVEDAGVVD